MSVATLIRWTGSTWSPWLGCRKVSEGCANCYITGTTPFRTRNLVHGGRREYLSPAYWKQPVKWDREALRDGRRHRVFPSLCDWLDDEVPVQHLAFFLELVRRTPNIDWQLLTKRPQNWKARMEAVQQYAADNNLFKLGCFAASWWLGTPPPNVWIGVSTENQARADERIPLMFEIPAVLYFISAEPLLGPLNLVSRSEQRGEHYKTITGTGWLGNPCSHCSDGRYVEPDTNANVCPHCEGTGLSNEPRIGWIIAGGESVKPWEQGKIRVADPAWFRFLRDQADIAEVPFFFKQHGGTDREKGGHILDGHTYEEMPEVFA